MGYNRTLCPVIHTDQQFLGRRTVPRLKETAKLIFDVFVESFGQRRVPNISYLEKCFAYVPESDRKKHVVVFSGYRSH